MLLELLRLLSLLHKACICSCVPALSNYFTGWRRLRWHASTRSLWYSNERLRPRPRLSSVQWCFCECVCVHVASNLLFRVSHRKDINIGLVKNLNQGWLIPSKKGIKGRFPAIVFVAGFTCSVIEGGCSVLPLSLIISSLQEIHAAMIKLVQNT